jgi:hypothetical protein
VLLDLVGAWPAQRPSEPLVRALLTVALPEGPLPEGTAFEELDADQRRVVAVLASAPQVWTFADTSDPLLDYGLPESRQGLASYAGLG